jgi:hypothetical protein
MATTWAGALPEWQKSRLEDGKQHLPESRDLRVLALLAVHAQMAP